MATTGLNFAAEISDWVRETEDRMRAVFRESTSRVYEAVIDNAPVDTGFLRSSITVSKDAPQPLSRSKPDGSSFSANPTTATLTIAGAELGEVLYVNVTASYGAFVEYGTSKMAPRAYVGRAVQRWPQIVASVSQELQSRSEGRTPSN